MVREDRIWILRLIPIGVALAVGAFLAVAGKALEWSDTTTLVVGLALVAMLAVFGPPLLFLGRRMDVPSSSPSSLSARHGSDLIATERNDAPGMTHVWAKWPGLASGAESRGWLLLEAKSNEDLKLAEAKALRQLSLLGDATSRNAPDIDFAIAIRAIEEAHRREDNRTDHPDPWETASATFQRPSVIVDKNAVPA